MITSTRRWRIVAAAAFALLMPATATPAHAAPGDETSTLAKALKLQAQLYKTKQIGTTALDEGDVGGLPIAAGGDMSCSAGAQEVFCWGGGDTEPVAAGSPRLVSGPIAAGRAHLCALEYPEDSDGGDLYCWGDNTYGQVGDGTTTARTAPVKVHDDVLQVVTGADHTCAVLTDQTPLCWGRDDAGQVGQGAAGPPVLTPQPVAGLTDLIDVAAGGDSTCVIEESGAAKCWGSNSDGQIGDGTAGVTPVATPTAVDTSAIGAGTDLMQIEVGGRHACAVTEDLGVWCWGADDHGQLGDGAPLSGQNLPVDTGVEDVYAVSAGGDSSCAVDEDGHAWCWGDNTEGQLGTGDTTDQPEPAKVDQSGVATSGLYEDALDASGGLLFAISMGERHACAMDVSGNPYCWGDNADGQLGDGTTTDRLEPTATLLLPGTADDVVAQARDAEIGVDWSEPDELGAGSPMGYRVVALADSGYALCYSDDSTDTACTLTNLTNNAEYRIFVTTMASGGAATAASVRATPRGMATPAPDDDGKNDIAVGLPITGAAISLLLVIGAVMVLGGVLLRRKARDR